MEASTSAEGSTRGSSRRITAACWEASAAASAIREAAACEAEQLLAQAVAEGETIRRRARAEGREEGLSSVAAELVRLAAERERLLASAEAELVALAFEVARSVLAGWAEREREAVTVAARRALDRARERSRLRLRAHPEDVEAVRALVSGRLQGIGHVALLADPAVERGGVVLESEAGWIDATLSAQLSGLRRALEGERR